MLINKNLNYEKISRSIALYVCVALLPLNVWSAEFALMSFNVDEYVNKENPTPGEFHRADILTDELGINDLGGLFAILPADSKVPYHYHEARESVIMAISGEAIQVMEGEEFLFTAGNIIIVPPQTKHQTINRSQEGFRYIEFFTNPPVMSDFHLVE
jgi:mannose-6-phosphate isomerase-like protein (cupin superfamily)